MDFIDLIKRDINEKFEGDISGYLDYFEYFMFYEHKQCNLEYTYEIVEAPKGEGGGPDQFYLVKFTVKSNPDEVHYIKFPFFYSSWDGNDFEKTMDAMKEVYPVKRWITVFEDSPED